MDEILINYARKFKKILNYIEKYEQKYYNLSYYYTCMLLKRNDLKRMGK